MSGLNSLSNKRILLGISGGIAAYKSAELTRLLVKAGAEVRVVMTRAATEFITPLTMQALSGQRVHQDLLDAEAEAGMGHIQLARWADLVLVAPATADAMARIARGEAGDLLGTLILASPAPLVLAPAMNQAMWSDAATQANLDTLRGRNARLLGPARGSQACGDEGLGRMWEPEQILAACAGMFSSGLLAGRRLLITGGPTQEAVDPVRYLSNRSSGRMAYALAEEAAAAGGQVTLVSGPVSMPPPPRVPVVAVTSALEMRDAVLAELGVKGASAEESTAGVPRRAGEREGIDIFIGAAAVADYRPTAAATAKIKKSKNEDGMQLALTKNPDIIAEVAALDKTRRPFVVGFAAETDDLIANARAKLKDKNLDLLFANLATETFDSDSISVTALAAGLERRLPTANKHLAARTMLQLISERMAEKEGQTQALGCPSEAAEATRQ